MKSKVFKMMSSVATTCLFTISIAVTASLIVAPLASAADAIVPYNATHPVAFPIVTTWNTPPLATAKPKDPVYIPTIPGLITAPVYSINFRGGASPKDDGLVIKQSTVKGGKVTIPPGGFVFMFDGSGIPPMGGGMEFMFGKDNIYYQVDYPGAVIVKAENITIKLGQSVVVGDNIFTYIGAIGHGRLKNPTVDIKYKLGASWDPFGMSPALFSIGQTPDDPGKDNMHGSPAVLVARDPEYKPGGKKQAALMDYNQLFANRKDIAVDQIKFSTIYSADIQSWNICKAPLAYQDRAKKGEKIKVKNSIVELVDTSFDNNSQTATVRITEGGKTVAEKKLIWQPAKDKDYYQSPYNVEWQKRVLVKYKDITVQLLASQYATEDGVNKNGANLVVYKDCILVQEGQPSPWDKRFIEDKSLCPQGHPFGTMFYNKDEIVLTKEKNVFEGPTGYIKLVIDNVKGDTATFHLVSKTGASSLAFTKTGNIDLLLGKGRAIKQMVWEVGQAGQEEMYNRELEMGKTMGGK